MEKFEERARDIEDTERKSRTLVIRVQEEERMITMTENLSKSLKNIHTSIQETIKTQ